MHGESTDSWILLTYSSATVPIVGWSAQHSARLETSFCVQCWIEI